MRVSLNTVRQLVGFDLPPVDELVAKINQQLGGVEEVIDLGAKYKDALIVKVVGCEKHPNADKLSVCQIDAGNSYDNSPLTTNQSSLITVVCGAPNVHAGMWAVWLPPGSTVPSTYDDQDPFVLGSRELRGVVSNGMLASPKELGISDEHEGILEITESDLSPTTNYQSLAPGLSFAEAFGLDDTIIDIENKMFTHRPDLFGQLGVAREIFAILQPKLHEQPEMIRFTEPEWYWKIPEFKTISQVELEVFNEVPQKAPRFYVAAMSGVKVQKSPLWLQTTLLRWGGKSINNVVDLTNYIMFFTAQPTHAYDLAKLKGHKIGVRMAKPNEKIKLLNGKEYELNDDDIVIADGERAIGLAGIMGGSETEVDDSTTDIVLEVANFDMYTVRRSSMRHGLFTDALTRFNKGQSPLQNERVIDRLIELMQTMVGAKQASSVYSVPESSDDKTTINGQMYIEPSFINDRLGLNLSDAQICNLLRYVKFAGYMENGKMTITAPYWRTDIEQAEDIVEEVGRLYGFDKLPRELPKRSLSPAPISDKQKTKQKLRQIFSRLGANEVLTYSFVHEKLMQKSEQDTSQAFQLSNALSPDLQYYRLSVLPSLLDKVHMNIKAGHNEFVLYEIGKGQNKKFHLNDDNGLPSEMEFVDGVYSSKTAKDGAAFYYVRSLIERLCAELGTKVVFKPIDEPMDYPVTAPFDQSRSAMVETESGIFVGMIGELKQKVLANFKLSDYTAAFTLDLQGLVEVFSKQRNNYKPLLSYPKMEQDITLEISNEAKFAEVKSLIEKELTKLAEEHGYKYELLARDIFSQEGSDKKRLTFRILLAHPDRTLTTEETNKLTDRIAQSAKTLGANRI